MKILPIGLNITRKKIVIIGGGRIALQKIKVLSQFTKNISIVALSVNSEIKNSGFKYRLKAYEPDDLAGAFLVYACTDQKPLNTRIKRDASKLGILVNVVDSPAQCDFISPAIYKKGYMAVSVLSSGRNVKKSVAWRNRIRAIFEK